MLLIFDFYFSFLVFSHTLTHRYQGPCLLDAIDALQPPSRDYSKPLLLPICDVVKSQSQGQVSICGKVETGAVRSGSKVNLWCV